jgi:hypothetical protein
MRVASVRRLHFSRGLVLKEDATAATYTFEALSSINGLSPSALLMSSASAAAALVVERRRGTKPRMSSCERHFRTPLTAPLSTNRAPLLTRVAAADRGLAGIRGERWTNARGPRRKSTQSSS